MTRRLSLLARYRRLGLWARLAVWGSIASIVLGPIGLLISLFDRPQAPQQATVNQQSITAIDGFVVTGNGNSINYSKGFLRRVMACWLKSTG